MPDEDRVYLARQGNPEARQRMITGLLGVICSYAARKQWRMPESKRCYVMKYTDFMDLVSTGNFVLCEKLNESLKHPNPIAYLLKTIWHEMNNYRNRFQNAIDTPHLPGDYPHTILSIAKLSEEPDAIPDSHVTRLNTEYFVVHDSMETKEVRNYAPLYEAFTQLSKNAQVLLCRLYGLCGYGTESIAMIAGGNSTTKAYQAVKANKLRYLNNMRYYLEQKYPHFSQQYSFSHRKQRDLSFLHIPEGTMKKLQQAEETLKSEGTTISMNKLRILSGVNTRYASAYLQRIATFS
jgi:hypothetical protein